MAKKRTTAAKSNMRTFAEIENANRNSGTPKRTVGQIESNPNDTRWAAQAFTPTIRQYDYSRASEAAKPIASGIMSWLGDIGKRSEEARKEREKREKEEAKLKRHANGVTGESTTIRKSRAKSLLGNSSAMERSGGSYGVTGTSESGTTRTTTKKTGNLGGLDRHAGLRNLGKEQKGSVEGLLDYASKYTKGTHANGQTGYSTKIQGETKITDPNFYGYVENLRKNPNNYWRERSQEATYSPQGDQRGQVYAEKMINDTPGARERELERQRRQQEEQKRQFGNYLTGLVREGDTAWQSNTDRLGIAMYNQNRPAEEQITQQDLNAVRNRQNNTTGTTGMNYTTGPLQTQEQAFNTWMNNLQRKAFEALSYQGLKNYKEDGENRLTVEQQKAMNADVRKNAQSGMYDFLGNPLLMSDHGLRNWQETNRASAKENETGAADTLKRLETYGQDAETRADVQWGQVWDYIEGLDEQNELAIINGDYKNDQKENAQSTLGKLQRTADSRRHTSVMYANDFFNDRGMRESLEGMPQAEKREYVYNLLMQDKYTERTAKMNPQAKEDLDALIDNAIETMESTPTPEELEEQYRTQVITGNAYRSQLKEAEEEENRRTIMSGLQEQASALDLDGSYDPSIAPEVKIHYTDNAYTLREPEPQGTEIDKAYYWMNNPHVLNGAENVTEYTNKYMFATDEQVETFNKFYKFDKQNGTNCAGQYLRGGLDYYLTQALYDYQENRNTELAEDPVLGTLFRAASPAFNMVGGAMGTLGTGLALLGNEQAQDKTGNLYRMSKKVQDVRSVQNQNADKWVAENVHPWFEGKVNFLLNTVDSMADNIVAMGVGGKIGNAAFGAGTEGARNTAMKVIQAIMSSEATSSKMIEKLENGMDPTEAAVYAIGQGTIEWITERFSLETLLDPNMKEVLGDPLKRAAYFAKVTGAEGSEEIAADVLEMGFDAVMSAINGHESEIIKQYRKLIANDVDPKEAARRVFSDKITQIGLSGLAGAISGFGLGAAHYAGNKITQSNIGANIQNTDTILNNNAVNDLLESAKSIGPDTSSAQQAQSISEKLLKGKKVSKQSLGRLAQTVQVEAQEKLTQTVKDTVRDNVVKMLKENGVVKNTEQLADIITKAKTEGFDSLPKQHQQMLRDNEAAYKVFTDKSLTDKVKSNPDVGSLSEVLASTQNMMEGRTKEGYSPEDVGQHLADKTDYRQAEGEQKSGQRVVIVDHKYATFEGMQPVTDENGQETGEYKYAVRFDGDPQIHYVDAGQIKATNFNTAAVIHLREMSPGIYSGKFTNAMLSQIEKGNVTKIGQYASDAYKIRWAAYLQQEMPQKAISEDAAKELYMISQQDAAEEFRKDSARQTKSFRGVGKGRVMFGDVEYGTQEFEDKVSAIKDKDTQQNIRNVAQFAKESGVDLRFMDLDTEEGQKQYGSIDDGTITLNLSGKNFTLDAKTGAAVATGTHSIVVTMGHEMTHWLRSNNEAGYIRLRDFVVNKLQSEGVNLISRAEAKMAANRGAGNNISMTTAIEEIVADACDQVLGNPETMEYIKNNDAGLFKAIKGYVQDLVGRFERWAGRMRNSASYEARAMMKYANELSRIWLGAYNEVLTGKVQEAEQTQAEPQAEGQQNSENQENSERNSMAEIDAAYDQAVQDGNTEEQQRLVDNAAKIAFAGTMVRGKNGTLLRVYHGTNAEFTEFRRDMIGSTGRFEGSGFNFTPYDGRAKSYGRRVLTGYLNIEQPLSAKEKTISVIKLAQIIREADPTGDFIIADYARETRDYGKESFVRRESMTAARNIWESSDNDVDIYSYISAADSDAEGLIEAFSKLGYDGLIHYNDDGSIKTAVAFSSEQFKSAEPVTYDDEGKVIPLSERFNPDSKDIRYSISQPIMDDQGNEIATILPGGSVNVNYSLASWVYDDQRGKVMRAMKRLGYTDQQIQRYLEDIDSIAARIAADKTRLDYTADRSSKFLKKNSDVYKYTLDASTLCAKRLLYQGTFNAIQAQLPHTALKPGELIDLANMMYEMGYQTPCGICYVESRRRNTGNAAQQFLDKYDGEYIPTIAELTTTDGLARLKQEHPKTYEDFIKAMNKRGVGSVKLVQTRTDYRGEIRRMGKKTVAYLNGIGGLRVQSFSDFETPHMIDMMQAVVDMNLKGLKGQAYTKVPNFAWVFGMTGIKINLSLMGDVDENGNLIFDNREGMDIKDAMALRERYSKNVGTILVGKNVRHILAAMADPRIDFIIPFHKSGWTQEDFAKMKTLKGYEDFQAWQNERTLEGYTQDGKPIYKNVGSNIDPLSYWDPKLSGKENAQKYLDMCKERGIVPKFNNFLHDNGDGSWSLQEDGSTDGYWKLLIDFKMYDNEGHFAPQEVVKPNFNMAEAERVLSEYEGGANTLPVAQPVVERYVREYKAAHPGQTRFSFAEPNMDVANWMMNQTPGSLMTEGERQLVSAYRGLRTSIDLTQKRIRDYNSEIKTLEEKQQKTSEDRDRLTALKNKLESQEGKLERLQDELAQVTSTEGYAGMMYNASRFLRQHVEGRTQEQVEAAVDSMANEAARVAKEIEKNEEKLKKMEQTDSVKTVRRVMANRGLKETATYIRDNFATSMSQGELEGRLAGILLKKIDGQDVTTDIEALASDVMNSTVAFDTEETDEALRELRGRTIIISQAQQKELKGMNMTLKDIRQRTKGSGVKFEYAKPGQKGTLAGASATQMEEEIPSLRGKLTENETAALETFVQYVEGLLQTRKGNAADYGIEMNDVIASVTSLLDVMMNEELGGINPEELRKKVMKAKGAMGVAMQAMHDLKTTADALNLSGKKALGAMSFQRRDVQAAMDYYNQIARQAAEVERQRVRKDVIEKLRSENTQKLIAQEQKYRELMKKDRQARSIRDENETLRHQIATNIRRFRKFLTEETDQKNIPEETKALARFVSKMVVNHTLYGRRNVLYASPKELADFATRLMKMDANDGGFDADRDLNWLVVKAPNPADNDETAKERVMQDLIDIESGLLEYHNANGQGVVSLEDRRRALEKVQEAVSEIYDVIKARSEIEVNGRKMIVAEVAQSALEDMKNSRFKGERRGRGSKAVNAAVSGVGYGNLTPEYFFKMLKNKAISLLHNGMKDAENRSGLEALKAKERIAKIAEECGYSSWDGQEKHQVMTQSGPVTMTTEQIMSLYATWLRESNAMRPEETSHLLHGGFVLQENDQSKGKYRREQRSMRPIRMTEDMLDALQYSLTDKQRQFVHAIVEYMSTDLAALGNEASMKMFGIKKFTEKYYFPIKSWGGVLNKSSDSGITSKSDNRATRQSFSKRVTAGARNAIEIGDFTPTAMKHVVGMITYNTVGPAVENMNKVLNQQFKHGTETEMESGEVVDNTWKQNVRAAFRDAYGKQALEYLETFMLDINGGVGSRYGNSIWDKLLGVFKKSAVGGSLSVAAQQPLSYIRAAMMINPKYLAAAVNPKYWKGSFREMMEHSGVAVIKDMGKFDMNYGRSMIDYITPEAKTTKGKAAWNWIEDKSTSLPSKMDAMTWTRMWTACKLEQAALHPEMDQKSNEFMNLVAGRFNDLMRRTQVYDSVLVKSQNMRNQHPFAKTITSFMAEPTLSLNVLADAWMNIKEQGGKATAAKALATFLLSAAAQAAVKGIFSAGRTPDKKKTEWENFLYRFTYNLMGEANPLGLIPGFSSLIDLLKDGEMTDNSLSVIGKAKDIIESLGKLASGDTKRGWYRNIEDSVGQLVQLATNVPAKNAMRDFRALVNLFSGGRADALTGGGYAQRESSGAVIKYQTIEAMASEDLIGLINTWLGEAGYQTSIGGYEKRIYAARLRGDEKAEKELTEYYRLAKSSAEDPIKTLNQHLNTLAKKDDSLSAEEKADWMQENATTAGANNYVMDQLKKGELTPEQARKKLKELHPEKTEDDIWWDVDRKLYEKETGKESVSGYYYRLEDAVKNNKTEEIRSAIENLQKHGLANDKIKTQVNTKIKAEYMNADNNTKIRLRDAMQKAYRQLGLTAEDANKTIEKWKKDKDSSKPKKNTVKKSGFDENDPIGQYGKGNINLNARKVVKNEDGSISTERSMSFYDEDTGMEILVPTVVNGKIVSDDEAIEHYYQTGEYLGMFKTPQEADNYAELLHKRQDWYYNRKH